MRFSTKIWKAKSKKEPTTWSGIIAPAGVKAFPKGKSADSITVGIVQTQKEWEAIWKQVGDKAPKVEWEKSLVVFGYYGLVDDTLVIDEPTVKDGVCSFDVRAGEEASKPAKKKSGDTVKDRPFPFECAPKCHYPYMMRLQTRADVKRIVFTNDDKVLATMELAKK